MTKFPIQRTLAAILLGLASAGSALAQTTYTWTSAGNGAWSTPGNWSPGGGPPGALDTVQNNTVANGDLQVNGDRTVAVLQTVSGLPGSWIIRSSVNSTLTVGTINVANNGLAALTIRNANTSTSLLSLAAGNVNVSGLLLYGQPGTNPLSSLATSGTTTIFSGGDLRSNVTGSATFGVVDVQTGGSFTFANGADGDSRTASVTSLTGGGLVSGRSTGVTPTTGTLVISGTAGTTTFSGSIVNGAGGIVSLQKTAGSTQILSGANTYSGGTTVSAGTLLVNNTTGSGLGSGAVSVSGGVLGGTGIVAANNNDITFTGGSLAVGNVNDASGSGVVDFAITNGGGTVDFSLNASTTVRIDIWGAADYERLVFDSISTIALGGATLQIDSAFTGWAEGQTFQVIDWDGVTPGSQFSASLVLPDLGPSLTWDSSALYTTGNLSIIAVPEPQTGTLILGGIAALGWTILRKRRVVNR